jgi:ligand-binding sensor domain-containing protein
MTGRRTLFLCLSAVFMTMPTAARRLPLHLYTTAQGLPRNSVNCIVPDSSGLLWLCTSEGLVRFDGNDFRTFNREQGLPSSMVMSFVVSKTGGFWMTTGAGVCRLPPGSKIGHTCRLLSMDHKVGEFQFDTLVEAPNGGVWAATDKALYRSSADNRKLDLVAQFPGHYIEALGATPDGNVLVSADRGLYYWDGHSSHRVSEGQPAACEYGQVEVASPRDIWVVGSCDIYHVTGWDPPVKPRLEPASPGHPILAGFIAHRRDSSLWVTARPGLQDWEPAPNGGFVMRAGFGTAEGLPYPWVTRIAEDSQGNLWGATEGVGIFRVTYTEFHVYNDDDGLGSARIGSIFESRHGDLCVTTTPVSETDSPSQFRVKNGDRFEHIDLQPGRGFVGWGWGWNQVALQAQDGGWWFQTAHGLDRFPIAPLPRDLSGISPVRNYGLSSQLGEDEIFRIFEDSHGDLWISSDRPRNELIRLERASGRFHHWTTADGWPWDDIATAIREAKTGTFWFGTFHAVVRFRNGRFETISIPSAPSLSVVRDLFIDHAGRIWVATARNGLFRCDNPDDAAPVFRHYTVHEGLSSDSTRSLTEDNSGFIYLGTVRAVDRIDPKAPLGGGNILHYTAADGLPDAEQNVAYRDRQGHLWFGTLHGLAEFDPDHPDIRSTPEVHILRMRVRGEEIPLPWAGARNFAIHLQSNQTQVEFEYGGIDLRSLVSLRYQCRLVGVDSNWSQPSSRTSVNYTNLPPGEHSFEVRAVAADGAVGEGVASVFLDLEAPLWRRAWFLAIAVLASGAFIYWLYDYRVRHLLALERLRTRIATDLHDDIGASLTQISLLSEVGRRDPFRDVLSDIAGISRSMVEEMSDIVWAVSPRHDHFDSIVHRMRHFTEDALPDGEVDFDTAGLPTTLPLPLEYRRPLYLIFKEAVNNVARHAHASRMLVRIAAHEDSLELVIEDNGVGFDPAAARNGEGLASIRRRIKELSGSVSWETTPGKGTRLTVTMPMRARRSLPKLGGVLARLRG